MKQLVDNGETLKNKAINEGAVDYGEVRCFYTSVIGTTNVSTIKLNLFKQ